MNFAARSSLCPMIEPLEARIAPARIIFVGAPDLPNKADTNYGDAVANDGGPGFVSTMLAVGDPIADAVDPAHNQPNHFYLRLSKGDVLELFTGQDHSEVLLSVSAGNVVAFFNDDGDNEVQQTELVSLALGKDASLVLKSGVAGDIVTNLSENGTPALGDDTLNMTDLVSAKQGIKGLLIGGGAVTGKVLSGGNVSNVTINGGIQSILVGAAAFNETFDFFPGAGNGGDGTLTGVGGVQPGAGQDGGSITNVTLNDDLLNRIEAGGGGFGAKGGMLSQIVLTNDTTGFILRSGKGGDGGGGKTNGGNGGVVQNIFIAGRAEDPANPTPNNLMTIVSGAGGVSTAALQGKGGDGGAMSKVYVGFELAGKTVIASGDTLVDNVQVLSGAGGAGKNGGVGGAIKTVRANVTTANGAVPGDEIQVVGGMGGDSNIAGAGKTGGGASITDVDLRNFALTSGVGAPGLNASILVQAGAAGVAAGLSGSAKGGSVTNTTLLGSDHRVLGGDGSGGKVGGDGGFIKNLVILEGDGILAHNATIQTGKGGAGGAGNGGKGGELSGVRIDNGDFVILDINTTDGGRGGDGTGGKGGGGGLVKSININEVDSGFGFAGTLNLNSGIGGSGTKGGGDGGAISLVTLASEDLHAVVNSGVGGMVLAGGKGNGGNGGLLSSVELSVGDLDPLPVDRDITVKGGNGGDVLGTSGNGGRGADLKTVSARALGSVSLTAGTGGGGVAGVPGKGGDVLSSAGFATNGNGLLQAGDAGGTGLKPANGGSILGGSADKLAGIYAAQMVTVQAGNGTHGGAGGSIKFLGYGSTPGGPVVTPSGTIMVKAGNGSAEGKTAGKGGFLDSVFGSVTSGANQTLITAGIGGGNADKQADGGSISNLSLFLGGTAGAEVLIEAGDAGPGGANVSKGAKGGGVNGVQISGLDPTTLIRHISAGKGGDALKTGGQGGSLNEVRVLGLDIGLRQGAVYGYNSMGGLFAGAGGNAAAPAGKGVAGSVTNVSAAAIAAIVAGRDLVPEQATLVDFITVGTPTDLLRASEGDIDTTPANDTPDPNDPMNHYHPFVAARYATNNLVGAVVNPTATDGTRFHFNDANANGLYDLGEAPTDGLILAKNLVTNHLNFTAEARYADLLNGKVPESPIAEKLAGTKVLQEKQGYNAYTSGGTYKLSFSKEATAYLPVGATAADVQTALNNLASITAAGGVTVTSLDNGALRTFEITFNTTGDKKPITILHHPSYDYDNLV